MSTRLVLFDFDGTLADSFPWFLGIVDRLAQEHGFRRIEAHEVETLRSHSARQLVERFEIPLWKLPLIGRGMQKHMSREIERISLFPGIDQVLQGLADRGIRLAIVTSNSLGNVRKVLGPANAALIQHYACGAAIFGKRAKLRTILRKCGVSASEALCIGDEIRDLEAARAEGIPFGAVAWGYTIPEALRAQGPAMMFEEVGEILRKVG